MNTSGSVNIAQQQINDMLHGLTFREGKILTLKSAVTDDATIAKDLDQGESMNIF